MLLSEVQMPPPGPVKLWYEQVDEMTVSVSYQPRPIPRGPFCHTQIPAEDQKGGGLYKREIGQLSGTR